jgi:hypothetical protein
MDTGQNDLIRYIASKYPLFVITLATIQYTTARFQEGLERPVPVKSVTIDLDHLTVRVNFIEEYDGTMYQESYPIALLLPNMNIESNNKGTDVFSHLKENAAISHLFGGLPL